jgi:hypothetical protein
MKTPNRKVRSAAQVAMSKTNPSEPDAPQAPQPPIDRRPRYQVLTGSIGPVCANCGQGIRSHFEGYCEPPPETETDSEAIQRAMDAPEPGPDPEFLNEPTEPAELPARHCPQDDFIATDLEPLPGSRLVDQALEIINLLPDCPEREILLRRCALAVSHQMNVAGFMLEEELQ